MGKGAYGNKDKPSRFNGFNILQKEQEPSEWQWKKYSSLKEWQIFSIQQQFKVKTAIEEKEKKKSSKQAS